MIFCLWLWHGDDSFTLGDVICFPGVTCLLGKSTLYGNLYRNVNDNPNYLRVGSTHRSIGIRRFTYGMCTKANFTFWALSVSKINASAPTDSGLFPGRAFPLRVVAIITRHIYRFVRPLTSRFVPFPII